MDLSGLNLVYSTDGGKVDQPKEKKIAPGGDGIIRLLRDSHLH